MDKKVQPKMQQRTKTLQGEKTKNQDEGYHHRPQNGPIKVETPTDSSLY